MTKLTLEEKQELIRMALAAREKAYAPYSGTVYDLARGEFLYEAPPVPVKRSDTAAKKPVNRYLAAFISAAERLLLAAKSAEGRPNKELKKWTERIEAILRDMK